MSDTNIRHKLDKEILTQAFGEEKTAEEISKAYERIARSYAQVENAIAVLSDLYAGVSHIYFGGLSETLGIARRDDAHSVHSVWEEAVLGRIHPDDLQEKYLQELRFFRFLKHEPKKRRTDYYLTGGSGCGMPRTITFRSCIGCFTCRVPATACEWPFVYIIRTRERPFPDTGS